MQAPQMVDQIIEAMNLLGGHCYYKDLYKTIIDLYPDCTKRYSNIGNWKASIRATIERCSSDSKVFQQKKDLFYSFNGIGKGHWGVRTPKLTESTVDFSNDDEGFIEGKEFLKKHILRERNHYLKAEAVKRFKNLHNGQLFCEICGFNFEEKYGDIGKDFIEAHHSKPISEMKENEKTKIEDIVLLCLNCHSMIHRKRPWLSKNNIRRLLK